MVVRLRLFQNFESFRVLVCGGDGSVGWVLSEIDKLGLHKQVSKTTSHGLLCRITLMIIFFSLSNLYGQFRHQLKQGLGKAGSGGQLSPLKFGTEVRNCMWRLAICTILRGGVKINVSCYMIKLDYDLFPLLKKNGSRAPQRYADCSVCKIY